MKQLLCTGIIGLAAIITFSCSENKAAPQAKTTTLEKAALTTTTRAPVKKDGAAIGAIETDTYIMKLHRAFAYKPEGSDVLAGMKPKAGHKFIYLDVSLRNKSTKKLNGGFLFIALKIKGTDGKEYKKPAAGLAAYTSDHPEESNVNEYSALWEDFEPNEFHRDIIYCVEVPANLNNFMLHLPVDRQREEWKTTSFTIE